MAAGAGQAVKWQRLAYFQLAATALLGVFGVLALTGLIATPRDGGLGPLLVAVVFLGLAVRSRRRAHAFS